MLWQYTLRSKGAEGAADMAETVLRAFTGNSDITVSPPGEGDESECSPPALSFAVTGMTEEQLDSVLEQEVFSVRDPRVTFFIYPFGWAPPRFVFSLHKFRTKDTTKIAAAVRARLELPDVTEFMERLIKGNRLLREVPPGEAVVAILNSLEIRMLGVRRGANEEHPVANIYLDSPTEDSSEWFAWRDLLHGLKYRSDFHGIGVGYIAHTCKGCHSNDHPRGMCPFDSLPYWNGKALPPKDNYYGPRKEKRGDEESPGNRQNKPPSGRGGRSAARGKWRA